MYLLMSGNIYDYVENHGKTHVQCMIQLYKNKQESKQPLYMYVCVIKKLFARLLVLVIIEI